MVAIAQAVLPKPAAGIYLEMLLRVSAIGVHSIHAGMVPNLNCCIVLAQNAHHAGMEVRQMTSADAHHVKRKSAGMVSP